MKFPEGCVVNFDLRIIDLFEELAARDPLPDQDEGYILAGQAVPWEKTEYRVDIYQGSDIPIREYLRDGWLRFLESVGGLGA
jgi:hypothetical protein